MFGSHEKEKILEVRGLRKFYGSGEGAVKALDGVDMEVYDGELLVILGSSGTEGGDNSEQCHEHRKGRI